MSKPIVIVEEEKKMAKRAGPSKSLLGSLQMGNGGHRASNARAIIAADFSVTSGSGAGLGYALDIASVLSASPVGTNWYALFNQMRVRGGIAKFLPYGSAASAVTLGVVSYDADDDTTPSVGSVAFCAGAMRQQSMAYTQQGASTGVANTFATPSNPSGLLSFKFRTGPPMAASSAGIGTATKRYVGS